MKTAIIKYPFKLQDLVILEITKNYVDEEIHVIPVDFSQSNIDTSNADIVLGLGKENSKVISFKISNCQSFNNRDLEYLDYLRYNSQLPSLSCILLKNSLKSWRKGLLDLDNKKSNLGSYSNLDLNMILESYTGYKEDMIEELRLKSSIINEWISELCSAGKELKFNKISDTLLKNQILKNVNKSLVQDLNFYKNYEELEIELNTSSDSERLSFIEKSTLKREIPKLLKNNKKDTSRNNSNILNIMNIRNYEVWINIWFKSFIQNASKEINLSNLWNTCDFSKEGVVFNTTNKIIPNWKVLAKSEENVKFFVTPEPNTSNWSIISVRPSKYPLIESDLYYWIHVSKFLAKFDSLDKARKYTDYLIAEYERDSSKYISLEESLRLQKYGYKA